MPISLSLDMCAGVWTLHQPRTSLLDGETFMAWRDELLEALEQIDHAIELLVDLDGLTLHPSVALAYALVICRTPAIRDALYYNADRSTAAALQLAHPYVRLHADRASAIAALDELRADRFVLRRSGTVLTRSAIEALLADPSVREKKS